MSIPAYSPTTTQPEAGAFHTFLSSLDGFDSRPEGATKGRASSKVIMPYHDPLPGCTQPYRMPMGSISCPVEGCDKHAPYVFDPLWRLNEHMKMVHEWPRKNPQPDTDKRINGKSAKFKSRASDGRSSLGRAAASTQLPPVIRQPAPVEPTPPRERKMFLSAMETMKIDEWMASQPDDDDRDAPMPDAPPAAAVSASSPASSTPPSSPAVAVTDDAMIAEAKEYIAWLDTQKPLNTSQSAVRAVLAQMSERRLFRTGQVLPPRVLPSMLAVYHLLETRAADRASLPSSATSPGSSSSPGSVSPGGHRKKTIKFHSTMGTI